MRQLFFGAEVRAPWPKEVPYGRIVPERSRHLTLAFLGRVDWKTFEPVLQGFPDPLLQMGPVGQFDRCLFLPPLHPRVVAWRIAWFEHPRLMESIAGQLMEWLRPHGFSFTHRHFLPHVTVARAPFGQQEWNAAFCSLPMMVCGLHLYESCGSLSYEPIWSYPLVAPLEEIEHVADLAFMIRGETFPQLQLHAQIALAMVHPPLLAHFGQLKPADHFDDVIIQLNHLISIADTQEGCPFKAVSFCGKIEDDGPNRFRWEMIVDV